MQLLNAVVKRYGPKLVICCQVPLTSTQSKERKETLGKKKNDTTWRKEEKEDDYLEVMQASHFPLFSFIPLSHKVDHFEGECQLTQPSYITDEQVCKHCRCFQKVEHGVGAMISESCSNSL